MRPPAPGVPPFAIDDPRWKAAVWGWSSHGFLRRAYRARIEELMRVCEAAGQEHSKEQYAYWAYITYWQCEFWDEPPGTACIAPSMSSPESRALPPGTEVLVLFSASNQRRLIWSMGTGQLVAPQERPPEALCAFDDNWEGQCPTLGLDVAGCLAWGSECWFVERKQGEAWLQRRIKDGYDVWPLDIREMRLEQSLASANVCGDGS